MDGENRSDQQKNFDRWLDSALHARVDTEPRMGLEERVLARLASEPQRARVGLWPLFAVASAAILVVIGIAVLRPGRTSSDVVARQNHSGSAAEIDRQSPIGTISAPNQEALAPVHIRHSHANRRRCCHAETAQASLGRSESLPKLAAFPAPRPETKQERLLRRLAAQPDLLQTAHLNADLPLRELSIPPLNIPPMEGTPPDNSPLY